MTLNNHKITEQEYIRFELMFQFKVKRPSLLGRTEKAGRHKPGYMAPPWAIAGLFGAAPWQIRGWAGSSPEWEKCNSKYIWWICRAYSFQQWYFPFDSSDGWHIQERVVGTICIFRRFPISKSPIATSKDDVPQKVRIIGCYFCPTRSFNMLDMDSNDGSRPQLPQTIMVSAPDKHV